MCAAHVKRTRDGGASWVAADHSDAAKDFRHPVETDSQPSGNHPRF